MKIWLHPYEDYQHQYYPLTSTTFALMYWFWKFNFLGYHLVNIAFHCCNGLLLWRLLTQLKVPGAYWAAMLFAVLPVNLQSVAWMIELKNVQSCFFYLASAVTFVSCMNRLGKAKWGWYMAAVLLFACALLSKAATSSLPIGLVFILFWKRRETFLKEMALLIPFFILGFGFAGFVKHLEENFSGHQIDYGLNIYDRFVLLGQMLWFYASKIVMPIDIRFIYPKWQVDAAMPLQWLPTIGLVFVVGLFFKLRKKWGMGPLVGMLYFIFAVGPLAFVNVAYMRFSYVANHWVYWASLAFAALMGAALVQIFTRPQTRRVVMLLIVLTLGIRSWNHAHLYQSSALTWQHVLEVNPALSMPHLNLANDLRETETSNSYHHYLLALKYDPYNFNARFGLGTLYLKLHQPMLARFYTTQALVYNPRDKRYIYQNARAKIALGQVDEVQKMLARILKSHPDEFHSIVLLAHVYLIQNKIEQAQELADRATKIDPDDQQTLGINGMVLARLGDYEKALPLLHQAVILNKSFSDGLLTLGVIHHQQGNLPQAKIYYQRVLDLNKNSVAGHEKLGLAYWEEGAWQNAMTHCYQAYELDSTRLLAGRRAADAMGQLGQFDESLVLFEKLHHQVSKSPQVTNELAWLKMVMGQKDSLQLAKTVALMTNHRVALVLDTLAGCYAVNGDFKRATQVAMQALEITQASGEKKLHEGLEQRLALYQKQQLWNRYSRDAIAQPTN